MRPEYVGLAEAASPGTLRAEVQQVQDIGTYWLLTARVGGQTLKLRLNAQSRPPAPGAEVWLQVLGAHTCFYGRDEQLINVKEGLAA